MANQNGSMYGLTILSPIIDDDRATPSHDLQIRAVLAAMPTDGRSPFALAPGTHIARLVVMDDVIYVGMPSCEEHLKSKYLVFESNFDRAPDTALDADIDGYLAGLARAVQPQLDSIWSHCVGYPGASDIAAFIRYMKSCQLTTTFYFAAVNDQSLPQTLKALQTQRAVGDFITAHQGVEAGQLQSAFNNFLGRLDAMPPPQPAAASVSREIKTGGRNE